MKRPCQWIGENNGSESRLALLRLQSVSSRQEKDMLHVRQAHPFPLLRRTQVVRWYKLEFFSGLFEKKETVDFFMADASRQISWHPWWLTKLDYSWQPCSRFSLLQLLMLLEFLCCLSSCTVWVLLSSTAVFFSSLALWVTVVSGLVLLLSVESWARSDRLACLCLGALFCAWIYPQDLDLI
jgi:hypothetical protein